MRKKRIGVLSIFLISFLIQTPLFADSTVENAKAVEILQKKGEVYFTFNIEKAEEVIELTKVISIDNIKEKTVFAYASLNEFEAFKKLGYDFTVLTHPGDMIPEVKMYDFEKSDSVQWDAYPTYESYVALMNRFQTTYPNLCEIVEVGQSVNGRKILFAKISDNVSADEAEPKFMYSSTMHGDETVGYVLMLRLIDSLLTTYSTDSTVADMVNNTEIWINPLANPDGTYRTGNSTVNGATRSNGNNIDLNRNFPNPVSSSGAVQVETQAMLDLAGSRNFTLSANIHSGAELVNYVWDSWVSSEKTHADHIWFRDLSRAYADDVQANSPSAYMREQDNGITHGGDWYLAFGTRQDYMTYYQNCREVTLELSAVKLLQPELLTAHWDYNKEALFNYIGKCRLGINGVVSDTQSGLPLTSKISIVGHDSDSSFVNSSLLHGDFYRPVSSGTYDVEVSCDGYETKVIPNVVVTNGQAVSLNVTLDAVRTVPNSQKILISGELSPIGTAALSQSALYDVTVTMYDSEVSGTVLYKEEFLKTNSQGVEVVNKHLNFYLGNGTTAHELQSVVSGNNNIWVEIAVDGDVLSRLPLTSSPYVKIN